MLKQANLLCLVLTRIRLQPRGASPENVAQRVGMFSRPGSLRSDQLNAERVGDLARDLVLQGEKIARVAIEPLGPQMSIGLGIDQLRVYADTDARLPDASLTAISRPLQRISSWSIGVALRTSVRTRTRLPLAGRASTAPGSPSSTVSVSNGPLVVSHRR